MYEEYLKEVKHSIVSDLSILTDMLEFYDSKQVRDKQRSCTHCSSSDALYLDTRNKEHYKCTCFSCTSRFNVIDLVMYKENLSFIEAIKFIANKFHIELLEEEYTEEQKQAWKEKNKDKLKRNNVLDRIDFSINKNSRISADKKFQLACLSDDIKDNKLNVDKEITEIINYSNSNYFADEVIDIVNKISEQKYPIMNVLASTKYEKLTSLLISPTGSGKTYILINLLKQMDMKALFILPNSADVQQVAKNYGIGGAYNKINVIKQLEANSIVAMTWDKTAKLKDYDLSNYVLIIDEVHQTFADMYRAKAIKNLYNIVDRCKARIDITATPSKLDFSIYDYILEYKQQVQTNYKVKVYKHKNVGQIIDIMNKSKKSALLFNNIKMLEFIKSKLLKKAEIIHSDNKEDNELYKAIMDCQSISDYCHLLNTTTLLASVNIYDEEVTDIIVVGLKDVATIKQYVARFRDLKECNVHIFNEYEDISKCYEVEQLIKDNIEEAEDTVNFINKKAKKKHEYDVVASIVQGLNTKDDSLYYCNDREAHIVNKTYIRAIVYQRYYAKRTIRDFKVLLEEYFTDVEVVTNEECTLKDEIIEYLTDKKVLELDAKELLYQNRKILVGYKELTKCENKSLALVEYMFTNNLKEAEVLEQYNDLGIHQAIKDNKLNSFVELFSNYVTQNYFSVELAWTLAEMDNRARGKVFAQINSIMYRKLMEELPLLVNEIILGNQIYEFLTAKVKVGQAYTKEHLEILAKELENEFKVKYSVTKIGSLLKQIYIVKGEKVKMCPQLESTFIYNSSPNYGQNEENNKKSNKRVNIYSVEKFIEEEDIFKTLNLENDNSISTNLEMRLYKLKMKNKNLLDADVKIEQKKITQLHNQVILNLNKIF